MIDETLLEKIAAYEPSAETIALLRATPIALMVGISGVGKDTILDELLKTGRYHRIVSHTTRRPRANHGKIEQDGVDYHYIDMPTALQMLDEQAFIEAKIYNGKVYGTSAAEIKQAHDEGKVATSDVEVKGVAEYVELTPTIRPIFILPPSYEVWQQRFLSRYGPDAASYAADIKRRLRIAYEELQHVRSTDYYSLVVNDDLAKAVVEVDRLARTSDLIPVRKPAALQLINDLIARLTAKLA